MVTFFLCVSAGNFFIFVRDLFQLLTAYCLLLTAFVSAPRIQALL